MATLTYNEQGYTDNGALGSFTPLQNPTVPKTVTPTVLTSKPAQTDYDSIVSTMNNTLTGMKNQAATVQATNAAKAEADAATKAAADQKAAADLAASQKQQEIDLKKSALSETPTLAPNLPTDDIFKGAIQKNVSEIKEVVENPDGTRVVRYNDGTSQVIGKAPFGTPSTKTAEQISDTAFQRAEETFNRIQDIQNGVVPLTASEQAQIDDLKRTYQSAIDELKTANSANLGIQSVAGFRRGATEYTPELEASRLNDIVAKGTSKVADLTGKMASAAAAMEQSFRSNDISALRQANDDFQAASKSRVDYLTKIKEDTAKALQDVRDFNAKQAIETAKITKDFNYEKNKILIEAKKNGASPEVIADINAATSVADAVNAAGDALESGTGIVGEYVTYKRDATSRGLPVLSFDEYQTRDANRKISIAKAATTNGAGLTPQQNSSFLRITDKFQADEIMKNALKGQTALQIAEQVIANPGSATNQLKSLYVLVKSLDPDSAVREGEIGLAEKTQSYLQKWASSLARVSEGRVIAPETAKALAEATKDLVSSWNTTASKRERQYKAQARGSDPVVGNAFESYLSDFQDIPETGQDIIQTGEKAKATVDTFITNNPGKEDMIIGLYDNGASDEDVYEYLKLQNLIQE